ncbi:MAG TPA: isoprenylcysteine carboxylmethyltransferase family protein [Thermoanaerobaculia bacterium]|nr:isoprenylcysteine carboxylmethyltransferase family protein [Thermoanaerobaculia bacterium]
MRATIFEFRFRFWIIAAIFFAAFYCYAFDHVNLGVALVRALGGRGMNVEDGSGRLALQGIFLLGTLVVAAAASIRTWAAAYLARDVIHDSRMHGDALVADGPYRHVRNPLYIGTFLLAAGMGVMASRLGFVVLVAGIGLLVLRLIGREEALLAEEQGASYEAFRAAVPRVIPALRPRLPASGARPRWGEALIGEGYMWCFVLSMLGFSLTFNMRIFDWLIALSLVSYVIVNLWWKRLRPKRNQPDP